MGTTAAGRSTIIATGTGSGKTECFLLPILDHCRAASPAPGIKAVLVYPMLNYLLVRPFDFRLWRHNGPDTLRYLVVDELHTFDGAQGTDLACLIRRLRVRLRVSPGKLICVGTSATLGGAGHARAGRHAGDPGGAGGAGDPGHAGGMGEAGGAGGGAGAEAGTVAGPNAS